MSRRLLSLLALATLAAPLALRAEGPSQLPANARVAIIGDSITEQKIYSKFIETYLLACLGRKDISCFQFGWGGETAAGFSARLENDLSAFHPNVATTCYGMNDGHYVPYADAIGNDYEKWMRFVLTDLKKIGVSHIVVGTPGAVDTKYFNKAGATADQYNDSLAHLGAIDRKLAGEYHTAFADVHDEMLQAMIKAKAKLGADFDVCGHDGVHPQPDGHLLMAEAFLKGLGCDGNIGEITVDMRGGSSASAGHHATGSNGVAEIESTTWPFCFDGDAKSSGGTRSILPFCKFTQELDRLTLRVKNLDAGKAKVTWGAETREFSKEQLAEGINLMEEFSKTPFDQPFFTFMNAVRLKQEYETPMIKNMISGFRSFSNDAKADAAFASALDTLKNKLISKQQKLDAAERVLLVPVKHTIKVEAVK